MVRKPEYFLHRYCDDLTFSGSRYAIKESCVFSKVRSMLFFRGFELNQKKTVFASSARQQRVTGVVVNEKPALSRQPPDTAGGLFCSEIRRKEQPAPPEDPALSGGIPALPYGAHLLCAPATAGKPRNAGEFPARKGTDVTAAHKLIPANKNRLPCPAQQAAFFRKNNRSAAIKIAKKAPKHLLRSQLSERYWKGFRGIIGISRSQPERSPLSS